MKGCWSCLQIDSGKKCSQCGSSLVKLTKTEEAVLEFCRDYDPNDTEE